MVAVSRETSKPDAIGTAQTTTFYTPLPHSHQEPCNCYYSSNKLVPKKDCRVSLRACPQTGNLWYWRLVIAHSCCAD